MYFNQYKTKYLQIAVIIKSKDVAHIRFEPVVLHCIRQNCAEVAGVPAAYPECNSDLEEQTERAPHHHKVVGGGAAGEHQVKERRDLWVGKEK